MSNLGDRVKDGLKNTRELIGSGVHGASSAVHAAAGDDFGGRDVADAARNAWKATVVGACIGAVAGLLNDDRKPSRGAIAGAFLGGTAGLALGIAWNARSVISAAAGSAARSVSSTRDAQWLARNPIDYA